MLRKYASRQYQRDVAGRRFGYVRVAIGAAMVVIGAFTEIFTAGTSSALVVAGMNMMMGGLAQILSPQAKNPEVRQADNSDSFYFDGPQNTTNQGKPGSAELRRRNSRWLANRKFLYHY